MPHGRRRLDTWDGAAASFGQRRYSAAHDQTPDSPPDRPRSRLPRGPGEALRRRHGPPGRRVRPPLCRRPRQSDRSQPPSQAPQKAQALADLPRNTGTAGRIAGEHGLLTGREGLDTWDGLDAVCR